MTFGPPCVYYLPPLFISGGPGDRHRGHPHLQRRHHRPLHKGLGDLPRRQRTLRTDPPENVKDLRGGLPGGTDGCGAEPRNRTGEETCVYRVGQKFVTRINGLMEFSRQTAHVQLTEENQMGRDFWPTLYVQGVRKVGLYFSDVATRDGGFLSEWEKMKMPLISFKFEFPAIS